MTDYRNKAYPIQDNGLDIVNPPDKIVPGKWYSIINAYPQGNNVLTKRKGFSSFWDQGLNGKDVNQIFPITKTVSLFSTTALGGTIGITDPLNVNATSLDTGWSIPTFVSARVPYLQGGGTFLPYGPVPDTFDYPTMPNQTWNFASSSTKMAKFAFPPILSTGSLITEFFWGLTAPSFTPTTLLPGSAGGQNSSVSGASPYTYVLTYFSNLTGAESVPSSESVGINSTLQAIQLNFPSYAGPTDLQYECYRIYRKGGTQVSTYRLVDTISITSMTYTDIKSDNTISTSTPLNLDNFKPFATTSFTGATVYGTPLPYIWGPFLGQFIFACGDVVQPGSIFWTNPGRPDTMDPNNNISVTSPQEPLMNGFLYASNSFVWSQQRLFALDYGGPTAIPTFTAREIPINMGLAVPFGFTVSSLGGVFFVGNDGIYMTDCQGSVQSITQDSLRPIFRGESAGGFSPVKLIDSSGNPSTAIRLFSTGQELHFIYLDTAGHYQHLLYNILDKSWRQFQLGISGKHITCGEPLGTTEASYVMGTDAVGDTDLHTRLLTYDNNSISPPFDNFNPYQITARTGGSDMEIPETLKEFGNVIIDADVGGGTLTVTPYFDEVAGTPSILTGTGRQRYPVSLGDTYGYFAQIQFSWSSTDNIKIYNIEYLFRVDQEVLVHWETPESALGLNGWLHLRDGYFALRSTSDIALQVVIDGVSYPYTIPSTGGNLQKVYMKFNPVKGKMYRFILNATGSGAFRLYGVDTQLNIKPWNTNVGYQAVKPFVAPGIATFLRNEAGT